MLIPDLTDDFLKNILKGDYTCGGAVLVGNDCQVELLFLKLSHKIVYLLVDCHVDNGLEYALNGRRLVKCSKVEILVIKYADDVVNVSVVHRDSGVAGFAEGLCYLLLAGV